MFANMRPVPDNRLRTLLIALLLGSITVIAFWPATKNDFINFDDQLYLTDNPQVKSGITASSLRYAFTSGDVGNWHPVTWLSLLLDVQLYGMKPAAIHRTSVILHAVNGMLLFLLLQTMTGAMWRSAFVAGAFALHPLRVESVAWASERKDLLCAFFGFLALLAYCYYVRSKVRAGGRPRRWYAAALVFQALGLMSKPMLVTMPCLLLLLDYWPLKRFRSSGAQAGTEKTRWLLVEKIPFVLLTFASSVVTLIAQTAAGAVATTQSMPLGLRATNALVSYTTYLWKILWPVDLSAFYPYPLTRPESLVALSLVVLVGFSVACWIARKSSPWLATGWLWYVGLMIPVIGLVQVGSQSMADRYTYLPSIGITIMVAWGIGTALTKQDLLKPLLAAVAALLLGWWSVLSLNQVQLWRDSETLFTHALGVTEDNAIAHESLALVLAERGSVRQAAYHFAEAVRIWPHFSDAYSDLGLSLSLQNKFPEAVKQCTAAVNLNPASERFRFNLAKTYSRMGSNDLAQAQYEELLKYNPKSRPASFALADSLIAQHKNAEAIRLLTSVAQQFPGESEPLRALSYALTADGREDDAINTLKKAVTINSKDPAAHGRLGVMLLDRTNLSEAVIHLETALKLAPSADYHLALAEAYASLNDNAQAIAHYEKCLELKPNIPSTMNNLAWMLATVPQANLRNGKRAVELGENSCQLTDRKEPFLLGTLAAAYAEAGRFDDAVRTAEEAITLAKANGMADTAKRNTELLELYRKGQPFHETVQ